MFEQLFGSKTRAELIKFFLNNPSSNFFVRELSRATGLQLNSVRRELENLIELKLIKESKGDDEKKRYYQVNPKCVFLNDLTLLFSKANVLLEDRFLKKLATLGEVKYFALSGKFVDDFKAKTDLILIGEDLQVAKIEQQIKKLEKETNRDLNYTILEYEEYTLRRDIADRFLEGILENPNNIIVVNKLFK